MSSGFFILCLMGALSKLAFGKGEIVQNEQGCTKPPTGTWLMDHFTPLRPDDPARVHYARTVLHLRELRENVFVEIRDIYKSDLWTYHLAGIFNPKTCMFSGIEFNVKDNPLYVDAIEYFYDGEQLKGLFVFSGPTPGRPERRVFPQTAFDNATFTYLP